MWLLRSRWSFGHQDQPNWLMSYIYVISVICHKMSYYDEWCIWHNIQCCWIWCLKHRLGPSNVTWCFDFCKKMFWNNKIKMVFAFFSLYKLWKSFVFLGLKGHLPRRVGGGSTTHRKMPKTNVSAKKPKPKFFWKIKINHLALKRTHQTKR